MPTKTIRRTGALTLFISASTALASPTAVAEFESILRATDCVRVSQERAFNLRVLDRSFPMPRGYHFHGFDLGDAVFNLDTGLDPIDNLDKYPDPSSLEAAVRQWSKSKASVYYSSEREEENIDAAGKFEVIKWRGLTVYYKKERGGNAVKTNIYQAVMHNETDSGELSITAGSPQLIADIIACVQDTSE